MACHLVSDRPWSEPMLAFRINILSSYKKMNLNPMSAKCCPSCLVPCLGLKVLWKSLFSKSMLVWIKNAAWAALTLVIPWNLFQETESHICVLYHFPTFWWHMLLKSFLMEDRDLPILHSQYHGCWWPGDARSQGISSHGADLVLLKYSSFTTRWVNFVAKYRIIQADGDLFPDHAMLIQ